MYSFLSLQKCFKKSILLTRWGWTTSVTMWPTRYWTTRRRRRKPKLHTRSGSIEAIFVSSAFSLWNLSLICLMGKSFQFLEIEKFGITHGAGWHLALHQDTSYHLWKSRLIQWPSFQLYKKIARRISRRRPGGVGHFGREVWECHSQTLQSRHQGTTRSCH